MGLCEGPRKEERGPRSGEKCGAFCGGSGSLGPQWPVYFARSLFVLAVLGHREDTQLQERHSRGFIHKSPIQHHKQTSYTVELVAASEQLEQIVQQRIVHTVHIYSLR